MGFISSLTEEISEKPVNKNRDALTLIVRFREWNRHNSSSSNITMHVFIKWMKKYCTFDAHVLNSLTQLSLRGTEDL